MVKVYPVVKTDTDCSDYEVYVNGKRAELNTARVSAYPFNRRWPGHQRQIEQTELVNFLSMQSDEEVELKIIPKIPSFSVHIRPRSLEMQAHTIANGEIIIRVKGAAQFTVEPYGRNHALHVFIDEVSSYNIDITDKNVLYFGAGEHDAGIINLKSGQTLFIDEGAVVYATVKIFKAENVKILGRGILDNSKNIEVILYEGNIEYNQAAINNEYRDNAIDIICSKNVEIDGITVRDSLLYNVDAFSSENIHINNIKIIGCWRFNSDGVHFANCLNSSLRNSFLRTFDDSICVRGHANWEYDRLLDKIGNEYIFSCKNILIENCTVWNDWGKNLQVGTETYGKEVCGVRFENCKLIHTTGNALTVLLVDNAKIHDITFKNTLVEYDGYMLKPAIQNKDSDVYADSYNAEYSGYLINFTIMKHFEYSLIKTVEELGSVNGVNVENLQLYSVQKPNFLLWGDNPNSQTENVVFKGLYWNGEPISKELFEKQTEKNEFVKNIKLI